jgi:trehalose-phosphatase
MQPFPGAIVECKRLTASVHVRRVQGRHLAEVRDAILSVLADYPEFGLSAGVQTFDIRPRCSSHKGSAARWILEQLGGRECDAIAIGDDATDEDMFAELESGINFRVDPSGPTRAHYHIEQRQVFGLLSWIEGILEQRQPGR